MNMSNVAIDSKFVCIPFKQADWGYDENTFRTFNVRATMRIVTRLENITDMVCCAVAECMLSTEDEQHVKQTRYAMDKADESTKKQLVRQVSIRAVHAAVRKLKLPRGVSRSMVVKCICKLFLGGEK